MTAADPDEALTGVATYVRDLASALARRGHEAAHVYLGSGPRRRGDWAIRWSVRGTARCAAVSVRPAPRTELRERLRADAVGGTLTQALCAAVRSVDPDVVHLHDLSGVP